MEIGLSETGLRSLLSALEAVLEAVLEASKKRYRKRAGGGTGSVISFDEHIFQRQIRAGASNVVVTSLAAALTFLVNCKIQQSQARI